ncbi:MAG: hypothetical protein EZS28_035613 [Streblomastix strix]|uniref:Ubiquitin-like domain-containing protein n=1 Tax=Streblomastix strix TaxID=222440 RepID=A0A5J4UFI1_9EUKA|nr:MAG: hypothetical protein EZS28_035613 [Streblomastix strix]
MQYEIEETFFQIRKNTTLAKLMEAYSANMNKKLSTLRFLFDGNRIKKIDTPDSLDMEDGDLIDVMIQQISG